MQATLQCAMQDTSIRGCASGEVRILTRETNRSPEPATKTGGGKQRMNKHPRGHGAGSNHGTWEMEGCALKEYSSEVLGFL